jgi:very-short-patch-repair endonuclease
MKEGVALFNSLHATPEYYKRITEKAHDSVRGKKQTEEHRAKIALYNSKNIVHNSASENLIIENLKKQGIECIPQFPLGRYNIDFTIKELPIAVEIFGGCFHSSGRHSDRFIERSKYILDQGLSLVIIWTHCKTWPITDFTTQYLVSFCKFMSSNPTPIRQYRVITSNGGSLSGYRGYFNDIATVKALGCSDYIASEINSISG